MSIPPTETLRRLCLALPNVTEATMKRGPSYRVGGRIFAWERQAEGCATVWLKVPEGLQTVLVGSDPERFFVPPYVGPKGWVGLHLDDGTDWDEAAALVERSYRLIAPRRAQRS